MGVFFSKKKSKSNSNTGVQNNTTQHKVLAYATISNQKTSDAYNLDSILNGDLDEIFQNELFKTNSQLFSNDADITKNLTAEFNRIGNQGYLLQLGVPVEEAKTYAQHDIFSYAVLAGACICDIHNKDFLTEMSATNENFDPNLVITEDRHYGTGVCQQSWALQELPW